MKGVLTAVQRLIRGAPPPASLRDALRTLVSREDFATLVRGLGDERELVSHAATMLRVTEEILLGELAEVLRLPLFRGECALHIDELRAVDRHISLGILRSCACVPVVQGLERHPSKLVLTDPALLEGLPRRYLILPRELAPWQVVRGALDAAEQDAVRRRQLAESDVLGVAVEVAWRCLDSILHTAREHGAARVVLEVRGECPRYRFTSLNGVPVEGALHRALVVTLLKILTSERLTRGDRVYEVQFLADDGAFVLSQELPVGVAASVEATVTRAPLPLVAGKTPSVLLIDDNLTFAKVVERFLARYGVSVTHVENGAAALDRLQSGAINPTCIVCDVHMPTVNGVEFVPRLRRIAGHATTPLIMLTSDGDVALEIDLIAQGADAFVRKFHDPRLLWVHIERCIGRRAA